MEIIGTALKRQCLFIASDDRRCRQRQVRIKCSKCISKANKKVAFSSVNMVFYKFSFYVLCVMWCDVCVVNCVPCGREICWWIVGWGVVNYTGERIAVDF